MNDRLMLALAFSYNLYALLSLADKDKNLLVLRSYFGICYHIRNLLVARTDCYYKPQNMQHLWNL